MRSKTIIVSIWLHSLCVAMHATPDPSTACEAQHNSIIKEHTTTLANNPDDVNAHYQLGYECFFNESYDQAAYHFENAVDLCPKHFDVKRILYQLGRTYHLSGNLDQAEKTYQKLLALNPQHWPVHEHLGRIYLTRGDFRNGWDELFNSFFNRCDEDSKKTFWTGQNLKDKTILLKHTAGAGDGFQFIRYAQQMKKQGATIILQTGNAELFSLCPYIDQVINNKDSLPAHDFWATLYDLPSIFKSDLSAIPTSVPYMTAHPDLIAYWKEKLSLDKKFKVGICLHGKMLVDSATKRFVNNARNLPVKQLRKLAELKDVSVYSLQKYCFLPEINTELHQQDILLFDNDFDVARGSFMDTAAVMHNLDLIITVDTSIAHLAGALGVPVWLLLANVADWRWMEGRDNSPWYPTMRIFRQPKPGDWDSVMEHVKQELSALLKNYGL